MINKDCLEKGNLLSILRGVQVMAGFILLAITLTACARESSVEENKEEIISEHIESVKEDGTENAESNENKIEMSMEEAVSIGMEEAAKYYDNLQLTEVHSYDNDQNPDINAGEDGRREWWYVNFANEAENYVSILVADGEVINVEHFDSNGNTGLLDLNEIQLTAREAVKKAQEMGLKGGDPNNEVDWVSGYNFKMSYASLVDKPDESKIFLEVIGISPNGNFAHIDFDAVTGEVLLAEEEIDHGDEGFEWKAFE
ncbi:MAG: hypothetical protein HDR01_15340 [Lachnospiraceae bacterium]|nr:hypothetical protein [Lachnospiraceae bacterium]